MGTIVSIIFLFIAIICQTIKRSTSTKEDREFFKKYNNIKKITK